MTDLEQKIAHLQELQVTRSRNIHILEQRVADQGPEPPLHLLNKLEHERKQLRKVEEQLKRLKAQRPVNWKKWGVAGVVIVVLFIALTCIALLCALLLPKVPLLFAWPPKTPTMTPTSSPTHTPIISTATPTNTPPPPPLTPTPTTTGMPTSPTPTSVPITDTPTPTDTPMPTNTPLPTLTDTPLPTLTDTPLPTLTDTPLPTPTDTLTPVPSPTPTPTPTPLTVALITFHGRYVTAMRYEDDEKVWDWVLRAETTELKDWEKFTLLCLDNGKVAFETHHDRYVTAMAYESDGKVWDWVLRAETTELKDWEKFTFVEPETEKELLCSEVVFRLLEQGDVKIALKTYHGRYVTAMRYEDDEKVWDWVLRAETRTLSTWEKFTVKRPP